MAKVMRKEAWHMQRQDQASGSPPGDSRASTPETKICLLYYTLLTLTEDIPDDLSLEN